MDRAKAIAILQEAKKRQDDKEIDILSLAFDKQLQFIKDEAKLKVAICPRRSAKSFAAGLYMLNEAKENPGVSIGFVGLTRESAKKIIWKDILKVIDKRLKLDCKFNESDLTCTLPNGSILYIGGADANPDDFNKFLGNKFKLLIIDEASMWKQDLYEAVYTVLKPAMADYGGTICLLGTCGNMVQGLFYDLTKDVEQKEVLGWSVHVWTHQDNPHMAAKMKTEIDELIKARPGIEETPGFRQMYMNEWVIDSNARIYKYNEAKNTIAQLPNARYDYVLGVDLGWNDSNAFVLCAYSAHDNQLYIVETHKEPKMILDKVAIKIQEYQANYDIHTVVIDNANKQAVETMSARYSLALEPALKTAKADHIDLMNSDLICSRIKVLPGNDDLVKEWIELIWDPQAKKRGERKEHPSIDNHLCDATLYAWRHCYNYLATPVIEAPKFGSEAEIDKFFEDETIRLANQEDDGLSWLED